VKAGLKQAEGRVSVLEPAQEVLERLEETWAGQYEEKLGAIGSMGLNAVFPHNHYEVLLEHTTKRGTANLDIILVKDDKRVRLKGGSGGSIVQLLAYLLRHLTTVSPHPPLRLIEVLDEPFSMMAQAQRPALCALMRDITESLGFQLLFSSHEDELLDAADVALQVHPGGKVESLKISKGDRA
jgi:ABC-type cobalamin transport system ATPase subunit